MDLKNMDVKEASQERPHTVIPFLCNVQNKQIYRDKRWVNGCLGLEADGKEEGDG